MCLGVCSVGIYVGIYGDICGDICGDIWLGLGIN